MKIYVYLDESGSIHKNSTTAYFVIGGYFTFGNIYQVHKITNKYKKINKKHKEARGLELSKELKTRDMSLDEKMEILTKIQELDNFYGCAIQFNKDDMNKAIDKSNLFFNFGVKLLFSDVIIPLLPCDEEYEFILSVDNRNIGIGDLKDLEKYLNTEFCYDPYEFSVTYYDSATHYGIQLADFVANTMYMRSKDRKSVEPVIKLINVEKFRLGIFPGRNTRGRTAKIDMEKI